LADVRKTTPLLFLALMQVSFSAIAQDQAFRENLERSFDASCQASILRGQLEIYTKFIGITPKQISADLREKIQENTVPMFATCTCMRTKLAPEIIQKSSNETQVTVDISALSNESGCKPSAELVARVGQGLMRLFHAAPASWKILQIKRAAFSIDVPAKGRPSLFASYDQPPAALSRLVFLAPGTGSACNPREICVDKTTLEISSASESLAKHARFLGPEGSANLKRVIGQFGDQAQVVTSSHNFSNFALSRTPDHLSYSVDLIDGLPVEKTKTKRIWLVMFNSLKSDPRAVEFIPALASIVEVTFLDME